MAGVRSNVGANGSYQFAVPSLLRLSKWCKQFAVNRSNVLANGCYQFAVSSPPVVANGSPQFTAIGSKVLANEAQDYEQRACYIKAFGLDSEKLTFNKTMAFISTMPAIRLLFVFRAPRKTGKWLLPRCSCPQQCFSKWLPSICGPLAN